jgi:hypothetical protein
MRIENKKFMIQSDREKGLEIILICYVSGFSVIPGAHQ